MVHEVTHRLWRFKVGKIIKNSAQCAYCLDIIESKHRHDFVTCKCGRIAVDGGKDYLKRSVKEVNGGVDFEAIIELSEEEE